MPIGVWIGSRIPDVGLNRSAYPYQPLHDANLFAKLAFLSTFSSARPWSLVSGLSISSRYKPSTKSAVFFRSPDTRRSASCAVCQRGCGRARAVVGTQLAQHFDPGESWHARSSQHQIWRVLSCLSQCGLAISRFRTELFSATSRSLLEAHLDSVRNLRA